MRYGVFDAESYYADDYTLSKFTAEEYCRHEKFDLIGFSFGYLGEQPTWYTGDLDYLRSVAQALPWHDIFVIGHNMSAFDAIILTEVLQVRPAYYGCTLQLARRLHGAKVSNALGSLAKMYNLGMDKGDEVIHAKGKRRLDFTPYELARYGAYCDKDTIICGLLWQKLSPLFPKSELYIAHLCTKMWAEPRLVLDTGLLDAMGKELAVRKAELLGDVANLLGVGTAMTQAERMFHTQKLLRSDAKFAELLTRYDVDIPMKRSPKKRDAEGKAMQVYAFAKTDEGMTNLLEYEDSEDEDVNLAVQSLAAARLGTKSTIAESRVERFHGISIRGKLPVPYSYGKSHCDRYAGCLIAGTKITCYDPVRGLTKKRIVDVHITDLVWDGEEFVEHDGVQFQGMAEVIEHDGITGTVCHPVFTEEGTANTRSLADAKAAGTPVLDCREPSAREVDAARRRTWASLECVQM